MIYHLGIAILTFALTNIDDLLIMSLYFANPKYNKANIVVGQYLGIIALVGISLTGFFLGKIIDPKWIGMLGILPILIGFKDLYKLSKTHGEEETVVTNQKINIQFFNVAVVTVANGGDNLGVYTPLFANTAPSLIIFYISVFLVMIGVWCVLAFYFVTHPLMKKSVSKYGHIILPYFLIVLGIYILAESEAFTILF